MQIARDEGGGGTLTRENPELPTLAGPPVPMPAGPSLGESRQPTPDEVKAIQHALGVQEAGYGEDTKTAVANLQIDNGIQVNDSVDIGALTWSLVVNQYEKAQERLQKEERQDLSMPKAESRHSGLDSGSMDRDQNATRETPSKLPIQEEDRSWELIPYVKGGFKHQEKVPFAEPYCGWDKGLGVELGVADVKGDYVGPGREGIVTGYHVSALTTDAGVKWSDGKAKVGVSASLAKAEGDLGFHIGRLSIAFTGGVNVGGGLEAKMGNDGFSLKVSALLTGGIKIKWL